MGSFVDAAGQAARDHEAEAGEVAGQRPGDIERGRRGVTRPDDGDHRPCERGRVAVDPEKRGRIGNRRQPRRIGVPAEDQGAAAAGGEVVEQRGHGLRGPRQCQPGPVRTRLVEREVEAEGGQRRDRRSRQERTEQVGAQGAGEDGKSDGGGEVETGPPRRDGEAGCP